MSIRARLTLGFVAALALGAVGCDDPCGDLKDSCGGEAFCELCAEVAAAISDDTCQEALDNNSCDTGAGGGG